MLRKVGMTQEVFANQSPLAFDIRDRSKPMGAMFLQRHDYGLPDSSIQ